MYKKYTVSLVFPAYNEAANIHAAITSFQKTGIVDQIIVVDNNSTDGTAQLARKTGATVVREKLQGYGFALRRGLQTADRDLIVLAEPDGTFSAQDLPRLLEPFLVSKPVTDCVLGTRTDAAFIKKGANMSGWLRWGNIILAKLTQILYATPSLSDCGCTYRVFKKSVVKTILPFLTVGSSHFLPQTVITTHQAGYTFKEIPVSYSPRIGTSKITGSKIKSIEVGLKMLFLILSARITSKPGYYV